MVQTDPETERIWADFHAVVNMTSAELRGWLASDVDDTYTPDPDVDLDELSQGTLRLLAKRRSDLTEADLALAETVVEVAHGMLADPPSSDDEELSQAWRHTLMSMGHDPLRADSVQGADAEIDISS